MAKGALTLSHVLIIEDDPLIAMLLQERLEESGARSCCVAVTKAEATAVMRQPDIITSDVRLLEGSGPEAGERIHAKLEQVPVIFITCKRRDCSEQEKAGRNLGKPFK